MIQRRILTGLLASASVICLPTMAAAQATPPAATVADPASAQDPTQPGKTQATGEVSTTVTPPPPAATSLANPQDTVPAAAPVGQASTRGDEIVVTGSRVIQNGNNSPTPVTVVSTAQLQQVTPSNIPDALNRLPVFAGSGGQQTFNNGSSNAVGNYLNLRNVGRARTLVLFDGHRVGPTTQDNLVDTNTIPQLLIQRVDVVTGGASAVYGSDAITGVVNFIVDRKFEGLKAQAQYGISEFNDSQSMRFGVAAGKSLFGGRGHTEASYEYYDSAGIPNKLDREIGRRVYSEQGAGTAANPYHLIPDTRLTTTSFNGVIVANAANVGNPYRDFVFNGDGTLRPFVHGAPSGTNGVEIGGDGAYYSTPSLQSALRSHQAFGRFDYDLTDNISAYVQGSYTRSRNFTNYQNLEVRNFTVSSSNAFLAPQVTAAMLAAGRPTFVFSKMFADTRGLGIEAKVKNIFAVGGLTGKLGNFNWDLAYSRTQNTQRVTTNPNLSNARTSAALDAVRDPSGNIVCRVTLTNPGLYPGCVPLNLFGPNTITPAMYNYIIGASTYLLKQNQDDFAGSIAGTPFSTWAGPVRAAVSGEYRKLTLDVVSNAHPADRVNCTGLVYNCNANTPLFLSNVVSDARDRVQKVREAAFEVDVPLLKDFVLAQSLNLNGAVRYTHYSTSGNATTWKVGIDWHPTSDITIRGTRSRDIRAPSLNDLFAPLSVNPSGFTDLHTNLSGTANVSSQGNPALQIEVAKSMTAGVVVKPSFIPRFSLAVDYFDIKIGNAIGSVSGNNAATQQICETSNGTDPLCALFIRPLPFSDRSPLNYPTNVLSRPANLATLHTQGVDFEANYASPLFGGNFSLRALATYTAKLTTVTLPGQPPSYQAGAAGNNGAGQPKVRFTAFLHYDLKGASIDLQERWFSSTRQNSTHTLIFSDPDYPASAYTDMTLAYVMKGDGRRTTQVFLTVQNLLNRQPNPWVAPGGASSVPGLFIPATNGQDVIGRYFTAGVRARF